MDYSIFCVGDQKYVSCCHFIVILGYGICRTTNWSIKSQFTVCMCWRVCSSVFMIFMLILMCVCQCLQCVWALMGLVPAPAACFLALHTIAHNEPTAIFACLAEAQVFSKTNTLQTASQPHHSTHHTDRAVQPLSSPLASVDWPSFSAWSSLTAARLLIGGSCKMSNYCSLG